MSLGYAVRFRGFSRLPPLWKATRRGAGEATIAFNRDSPDDSGAEVNILRFSDLPAR